MRNRINQCLLKNKSVCILTNGNGDYIGIEADARPIIVNDISNAYKWENATKAQNALECLPNKIKKQSSFQMMIIETQHTQINKDFLKNKSFITNYINSFSIENLPDDSLYSALHKIEIALIDYLSMRTLNFSVMSGSVRLNKLVPDS